MEVLEKATVATEVIQTDLDLCICERRRVPFFGDLCSQVLNFKGSITHMD